VTEQTAQGEDVLAWLENAMVARERALAAAEGRRLYIDPSDGRVSEPDGTWADGHDRLPNRYGVWLPLFDATQELARVAADRKMMELHGGRAHSCPAVDCDGDDDQVRFYDHETCSVVLNLAKGYGWSAREDV
jgi:hypothetical protein